MTTAKRNSNLTLFDDAEYSQGGKTPQIAVRRDYDVLQAERAYNAEACPRTLRVLAARALARGDVAEAERLEARAAQSAKFWRKKVGAIR